MMDFVVPARLADLGFHLSTGGGQICLLPPIRFVPAGPFHLGADPMEDPQSSWWEQPQHTITLPAYLMATYPITVAEYQLAVVQGIVPAPEPAAQQYGQIVVDWDWQVLHRDHPVVVKNWSEARCYGQWLQHVTGAGWRLPTEAEWEKAARGTDGRIYPWGNQWDMTRMHTKDHGTWSTGPVGLYPQAASPFGVEDMLGNIWEMTSSASLRYPYQADDGREDPESEEYVVTRGGSWLSDPSGLRITVRGELMDDLPNIGFRLACSLENSS